MGQLACDGHGSSRAGRLYGVYPAVLRDGKRFHGYRRFCRDCMRDLLARHSKDWHDPYATSPEQSETACSFCDLVVSNGAQLQPFWVTLYPDGKNRRDYDAQYCPACADGVISEFELHV
jgi:ribosomal protein S27AE